MEQKINQDAFIGKNIKDARVAAELSQEQLTAKLQTLGCDISRGTLAKTEVGIRHIKASEIKVIKQILNIEYDDIFKG